jgi:arylsulfatase A-like enzyme
MRWDALSVYGQKAISTPNLDSIANEGTRFDKAYSSVPVCTPARAILLTSLKPWNNGQLAYAEVGTHYKQEMPRAFRDDLGYMTAIVGKNHFGYNKTSK